MFISQTAALDVTSQLSIFPQPLLCELYLYMVNAAKLHLTVSYLLYPTLYNKITHAICPFTCSCRLYEALFTVQFSRSTTNYAIWQFLLEILQKRFGPKKT